MKLKSFFLIFLLTALNVGALANAGYISVVTADKVTSSYYPFGQYEEFFKSTPDLPTLVSFDLEIRDNNCYIQDAKGLRFKLIKGKTYNFSELYYPVYLHDREDSDDCDNTEFTNIIFQVADVKSSLSEFRGVIDQSNQGFKLIKKYFSDLNGMEVDLTIDFKFYENFESMKCLKFELLDANNKKLTIDHTGTSHSFDSVVLPLTINYSGSCLTSKLDPDQRENKDFDFKYKLTFQIK